MNKIKNSKKGFTLIEILMVVLIIGLLAAMALPQYKKAVERAKLSEAITNLKAIEGSLQRHFLTRYELHDNFSLEDLDIDLSNANSKNFIYTGMGSDSFWRVEAQRKGNLYTLRLHIAYQHYGTVIGITRSCLPKNTSMGDYICGLLEDDGWTT